MSTERMVSKAIYKSEQFCDLSRDARSLFIGLIVNADDCGFITASPHALGLEIFPTDGLSREYIAGLRAEIETAGLAERYPLGDGEVLWLPHFIEHQRLRYRGNTKMLRRLIEAGVFAAEYDKHNRPVAVCPCQTALSATCLDQVSFREKRREEKRREISSPLPLTGRSAAQSNLSEHSAKIYGAWNGDGNFRSTARLLTAMQKLDAKQPELLLAHLLECDKLPPEFKKRTLYQRLRPGGGRKAIKPGDKALRVAKERINAGCPDDRGGGPTSLGDLLQQ